MRLVMKLFIAALALMLSGCASVDTAKPWYALAALKTEAPPLPSECGLPPAKEPKLPDDRDATDIDAVRHIEALKRAYRTERGRRLVCKAFMDAYRDTPGA
jgi:hypothetical protein